ncbi:MULTISPECIES: four helix bundle protein [Aequorivita]|uniref:Four helix bundle protein n=1 Tax=Aequorivita iocasae TaxID=2803865 RepID=A0ABX7DQQ5_9FLAO|nr:MULTISPECIES: four helix bundle protein [Aequorivita]QQX76408.1 four helix bundle protein [Aequorivita iocasae]UCA55878.1 four helix bundle protein [Aequorivita sp. F7]
MHKLEELKIWNKAMEVAEEVYLLTANFPNEEKFGLISQLRRSAVSIPSNIAEGAGRNTNGEFKNFLGIANGSSYELFTQLLLSIKLKLGSESLVNPILSKVIELQKMSYSLIKSLEK